MSKLEYLKILVTFNNSKDCRYYNLLNKLLAMLIAQGEVVSSMRDIVKNTNYQPSYQKYILESLDDIYKPSLRIIDATINAIQNHTVDDDILKISINASIVLDKFSEDYSRIASIIISDM